MANEPTPEERAEYIVKRLELFIRENREPFKGMNFNKWQQLARVEIANSMKDIEQMHKTDDQVSRRMLFIIGSSIATIGFWGVAAAFGKLDYMLAGMICIIAGIIVIAHAVNGQRVKCGKRRLRQNANVLIIMPSLLIVRSRTWKKN